MHLQNAYECGLLPLFALQDVHADLARSKKPQ